MAVMPDFDSYWEPHPLVVTFEPWTLNLEQLSLEKT